MPAVSPVQARLESDLAVLACKGESVDRQPSVPDWSIPACQPFWLPKKSVSYVVSQFYHGECATAEICHRIAGLVESPAARRFLATQIADERRHAEFYRRYIDLIGEPVAAAPALAAAYDQAQHWTGAPEALILAIHVVLEGENLRLQRTVQRWLPCPLFANISQIIARDEARHLAFGTRYLKATLSNLSATERRTIGIWLKGLWDTAVDDVSGRLGLPVYIGESRQFAAWRHNTWAERCETLHNVGLFGALEPATFFAAD